MYATEREERILNYLETHGVTPTAILQKVTGASIATVRRNLNALNSRGLVIKTHGAAQLRRKKMQPKVPPMTRRRRKTPTMPKRTRLRGRPPS